MKWTSCKVSQTARRGCSFSILQNKLTQQTSKTAFIKCFANSSMKFVFVQNRCYARKYEFFSCKYFETVNSLRCDNFMILDLKCFPWNWNLEPFLILYKDGISELGRWSTINFGQSVPDFWKFTSLSFFFNTVFHSDRIVLFLAFRSTENITN